MEPQSGWKNTPLVLFVTQVSPALTLQPYFQSSIMHATCLTYSVVHDLIVWCYLMNSTNYGTIQYANLSRCFPQQLLRYLQSTPLLRATDQVSRFFRTKTSTVKWGDFVPTWWVSATSRCDKSDVAQSQAIGRPASFLYILILTERETALSWMAQWQNCSPGTKCFLYKNKIFYISQP